MSASSDDYDTPWKDAVSRYFPEFMAFYFPRAHAAIDWRQPYVFLDQELAQVVQDAELGKRLVDKLVKVTSLAGLHEWVLVHIEVQGGRDSHFVERIFTYNYRLYDRHRRPVASLALPPELGARLWRDIAEWERSQSMPYLSSVERIGLERGIKQGLEQGREQGRQEGQATILARQLNKRFGTLPREIQERMAQAGSGQLAVWADAILDAPTLDEIFRCA